MTVWVDHIQDTATDTENGTPSLLTRAKRAIVRRKVDRWTITAGQMGMVGVALSLLTALVLLVAKCVALDDRVALLERYEKSGYYVRKDHEQRISHIEGMIGFPLPANRPMGPERGVEESP